MPLARAFTAELTDGIPREELDQLDQLISSLMERVSLSGSDQGAE